MPPWAGYSLAQKMVGKACNLPGVQPGMYCEPLMTTVGSRPRGTEGAPRRLSDRLLETHAVLLFPVILALPRFERRELAGKAWVVCSSLVAPGSQDTTGPMTRDELKDLACLGFSADLVMQSFCHTAAYPKPVDVTTHKTLPKFIHERGGVSLRPGDGIIHSWLNRMLVPDCVGTGGDSHTRFPLGISFPAGSGLVAFAGAAGVMPLDTADASTGGV